MVSTRPAASTRSLIEKVCESFLTWTCTGKASAAAKATAQSTHGRFRAVGAPGSGRTTMTNSTTATAVSAAVIIMIRWGTLSRSAREAVPAAPFVIVVTSSGIQDRSGPVRAGPAHAGPADTGPADTGPAHAGPADTGPAHAGPADTGPADTGPAHAGPAHAGPAHTGPA